MPVSARLLYVSARAASVVAWVNAPMTDLELEAGRHSVTRGMPFGNERWVRRTVRRLGLEASLHPRGRPRKRVEK